MNRHDHQEHYSVLETEERRQLLEIAGIVLALVGLFIFCILVLVAVATENRSYVGQYCLMLDSSSADTNHCITPEK